jgi:hypothetical protein
VTPRTKRLLDEDPSAIPRHWGHFSFATLFPVLQAFAEGPGSHGAFLRGPPPRPFFLPEAPMLLRATNMPAPQLAEERVVFVEEGKSGQYCRLVIRGEMDWHMIDALASFLERQRKRLNSCPPKPEVE